MSQNLKNNELKKVRAKFILPEQLGKLIELVNLVPKPKKRALKSLEFRLNNEKKKLLEYWLDDDYYFKTENGERILNEQGELFVLKNALKVCLDNLPKEFTDYIKGFSEYSLIEPEALIKTIIEDSSPKDIQIMAAKYTLFRELRNSMWEFANRIEKERLGEINSSYWAEHPLFLPVIPFRDAEGKLNKAGFGLIDFDESRLRICAIETCGKLFWAKKETARTCSAKCLNRYNVRQFRKNKSEED